MLTDDRGAMSSFWKQAGDLFNWMKSARGYARMLLEYQTPCPGPLEALDLFMRRIPQSQDSNLLYLPVGSVAIGLLTKMPREYGDLDLLVSSLNDNANIPEVYHFTWRGEVPRLVDINQADYDIIKVRFARRLQKREIILPEPRFFCDWLSRRTYQVDKPGYIHDLNALKSVYPEYF